LSQAEVDLPVLTPAAFRAQVASGATDPVYAIIGDDDHEKSVLALALGEMVEEDLRAFNVERQYAVDGLVTPQSVAEAARTLPMIAPRRVVIVLQAEKLFDPRKKRKGAPEPGDEDEAASSLDPLVDYLGDPSPTTTLAFVFSMADGAKSPAEIPLARNLKATKALLKVATLVVCTGLDGGKDAGAWIVQQAQASGLAIDRPAVNLLIQSSGGDTSRLRSDVEKLLLFAAGDGRITPAHVSAMAGSPVHHGDDWALVRAIEQGDAAGALRELQAALEAGGVPFQILGQIGYAVRTPPPRGRFPARRVPAAVDALLRTDLALKSSGGDPRVLLERLVVELCG
jgi:DNA polymerase-3 subunit delta